MLPLDIDLGDDDEAELDRIAEEVGREMWRELGLVTPPHERVAPDVAHDDAPTGDALRAIEAADTREAEARMRKPPEEEPKP